MTGLFMKLLNASLSAGILVLAVLVLRLVLKKAPKWITCCLWVLVAIRLVCPISLESSFSLIPSSIGSGSALAELTDQYVGEVHIYGEDTSEYQTAVEAGQEPIYAGRGTYYVVTGSDPASAPATVETEILPVLCGVWLLGVAAMLVYALVSYLRLKKKVSASLHLKFNIYLCDYIDSPFILGIFDARIYLPSSMEEARWPHVIAHEKAHLKRKDHWWKPLGYVLLSLHWFNPLLWLAYWLLCRDIELACDEKVIRDLGEPEKKAYSEALLECSVPRSMIAACPLAFGEVGVKERVVAVLDYKKPAFWIIVIAVIACAAAAVCFLTVPAAEEPIQPGIYVPSRGALYTDQVGDLSPHSVYAGYILDDDLYFYQQYSDGSIACLGQFQSYEVSAGEIVDYTPNTSWNVSRYTVKDAAEAYWLDAEDNCFYLLFKTRSGEVCIGYGWEDVGERWDGLSDDTRFLTLHELDNYTALPENAGHALEAQVIEVSAGALLVEPMPGSLERSSGDRFWVSLDKDSPCVLPEVSAGDTVRILYGGTWMESYPCQIADAYCVSILNEENSWGVYLSVTNVTPTGLDLEIYRPEGAGSEMIQTGSPFWLEVLTDNGWENIPCAESAFTTEAYRLAAGDAQQFSVNWEGIYGTLEPGTYRIGKNLSCSDVTMHYYAEFTIAEEPVQTPCRVSVEIVDASATEAIVAYRIYDLQDCSVWAGYDYWLEVLTGTGWAHYGHGVDGVAWDAGLQFSISQGDPEANPLPSEDVLVFHENWSNVADLPLPAGTYRFCKQVVIESPDLTRTETLYAEFTVSESATEGYGVTLEVLDPTPTGATLACTYHGGLLGQLSTTADYYLTVNVGYDGFTRYGPGSTPLERTENPTEDICAHLLMEGETVYLDIEWGQTVPAPLPSGTYQIVLWIDRTVTVLGQEENFPIQVVSEFTIP